MVKLFCLLALMTGASLASAAQSQYTVYSCSQKCGLTTNAPSSVYFSSLDRHDSVSALYSLCSNQNLNLQGDYQCQEQPMDLSSNERFQRCRTGISPLGSCFVSVHGFGPSDRYYRHFQESSAQSFDDAEAKAMAKCRASVGYGGTCSVGAYTAY